MRRVCLIVLDSLGVGGAPDAARFGDHGANTLGHIALACASGQADVDRAGPLKLPVLSSLGLGLAAALSTGHVPPGLEWAGPTRALYACARTISRGKDTPSGHFEMTGAPVLFDWGYLPETDSMPEELLAELIHRAKLPGVLGNCRASGTEILTRLGQAHLESGRPIVYTSADSVLQIAAHEEHFGLERLYDTCLTARELTTELRIARVIARPFIGNARQGFIRTAGRRDYGLPAPGPTILDHLCQAGGRVVCVGKVADIFSHRGVTETIRAAGHDQIMDATISAFARASGKTLILANFVDFDSVHGHRRDVAGYARALEKFDARLPEILRLLEPGDACFITADHGCDPTWTGTDHTREQVPILACGPDIASKNAGPRETLADVGASVAQFLDIAGTAYGQSFL